MADESKPRPTSQRKRKVAPGSTNSFCQFIRSLTDRIHKIDKYLERVGANDNQTRATRDGLIEDRRNALRNLPPKVKLEAVVKVCRELGLFEEMGLRSPSGRLLTPTATPTMPTENKTDAS